MQKINMITKPQEIFIGERYMFLIWNEIYTGVCKEINKEKATFDCGSESWEPRVEFRDNCIFTYNKNVFNEYKRLQEKHKKELEMCLKGKIGNNS